MKKRLLSVALILSMLASLLMVGITGPVSAAKDTYVTQEATYDRAIDLSKELTPNVNLTFDGEAKYGIPFGRYSKSTTVGYENDSFKLVGPGGNGYWVFFGTDGNVGESIVHFGNTASDAYDAAVANLYTVKAGNTYKVSFDVKALKGATVAASNTITFGTSADPSKGAANQTNMTVLSSSGFTLEYKVDGTAQNAGDVLGVDSDWQTATVTFTAKADGKFGICSKLSNTNIYIDNVKIYDLTEYGKSTTTQNRITFDEFTGGLGLSRYSGSDTYGTEENGNRYGILNLSGTNYSTYFASTEYSSRYTAVSNEYKTAAGLTNIDNAYSTMFKFESGKSYEVSFKYRYPEGQSVTKGTTELKMKLMADPAGATHGVDNLVTSGDCWAKDVMTEGTILNSDPGVWQECKVTFTVKTKEETAGYAKIRPVSDGDVSATYPDKYDMTIDETGVYFGILGTALVVHVDDYQVKELVNYRLVTLQTDNVYHDMENDTVNTSTGATANGTIVANNNEGTSIADSGDDKYGNVLVLDSTASRFTLTDSGIFEKGKKYYISFDAKSTSGTSGFTWISLGKDKTTANAIHKGSQQDPRVSIHSVANVYNALQWYVNGVKTNYSGFVLTENQWNHYGIVIDLTDADVVKAFETVKSDIFDVARWFYIGRPNSQFDNFRITAVNTMDDAIPTSDISYVSKEVYHDMETYGGFNEVEEGTAHIVNSHDKKYGQVLEITKTSKARIGFTDSNIITAGKKYYISFDAKTTNNTNRFMWLMISTTNTTKSPRFIVSDASHTYADNGTANDKGATDYTIAENGNAFKYYINDEKVHRDNFKLSGDWRKYTLVIDTSDPDLLAKSNATSGEIKNLLSGDAKYFYFGAENAWFDNFRMVEVSETAETISKEKAVYNTELSCREEGTSVDGEYVSAGLRFNAKLPNGIVSEADEIGFVAAPSSLAKETAGWYKLESEVNPVARKAIVKDDIRNYVYATEGDNTYYQLVFTGLSTEDGKTAYNRRFSAVLYIKIGDKYTYYPLGEASYHQAVGIKNFFSFDEITLDVSTMASQDYKIVYNAEDYQSWVVKNQITKLQQVLNNKSFGIEDIEVRADVDLTASNCEIVIGNTDRGTVGDVSALSNKNNYAIRISGSKVYVMGGSTYALQSAIYELETMVQAGKITEKEGSYLDTAVIDSTSEYKLVWQSEFDDPNTVTYGTNNLASIKNWWVDPLSVNTTSVKVKDSQAFLVSDSETVQWDNQGYLVLRAVRKEDSILPWNSETTWTNNTNLKYKQQGGIHCSEMEYNYGYVEMRARIPDGTGIYSSFWLNGQYNGSTPEVEIDIFESGGRQGALQANVHWWKLPNVVNDCSDTNKPFFTALNNVRTESSISYNKGTPTSIDYSSILTDNAWYQATKTWMQGYGATYNQFYPKPATEAKRLVLDPNVLYNEWHTIGLLWTDEVLELYCDGVLYHSRDIKEFKYPDGTHAFDNQFENIIGGFNLGWNERTSPTEDTTSSEYPTWDENGYLNYIIDYFRLYQIVDGETNTKIRPASGY